MLKPVKGIFFDIGWTLCYPPYHWMLNDKFREIVDPNVKSIVNERRMLCVLEDCLKNLECKSRIRTEEEEYELFRCFYRNVGERIRELHLTQYKIDTLAYDKVHNDKNYIFFQDVIPMLSELRREYRLGLLSDAWPSMERVLRDAGIYEFFPVKTFSYELGVYKPHPRMYADALCKMDLCPEETLLIDDEERCLRGAKAAGMQGILMDRRECVRRRREFPVIGSLYELKKLLPAG